MFKHLLLPTDGSPASNGAVKRGVAFAKSEHARITGLYVMPEFSVLTFRTEMLEGTREQFAAHARADADQFLAVAQDAAAEAGVDCDVVSATSNHPFEEIIKTAEERSCDLIVMASHGRRGVRGLLLGSETQKVLTHSKIPVLVFR
jgi:nucleotide-binding universal stress UspA family protein